MLPIPRIPILTFFMMMISFLQVGFYGNDFLCVTGFWRFAGRGQSPSFSSSTILRLPSPKEKAGERAAKYPSGEGPTVNARGSRQTARNNTLEICVKGFRSFLRTLFQKGS
jgi:hypothetical protein